MNKLVISAIIGGLLVLGAACVSQPGNTTVKPVSQEESRQVAEQFIKNEPTFVYDGMPETLVLIAAKAGEYPSSWHFTFEFTSRHAGYGDRAGQVLAQVLTPHKVEITVEQAEVKSAIMDQKWDMIKQRII